MTSHLEEAMSRRMGREIVAAWNAGSIEHLLAEGARPATLLMVCGRGGDEMSVLSYGGSVARSEIRAAMGRHPRLELVSALESSGCLSLVLRDGSGATFTVSCEVNGEGKIDSILTLRPI